MDLSPWNYGTSGLSFTLKKAKQHLDGSGRGQSEWPVQGPDGLRSHPVPLLGGIQAGFVHQQRALAEAGEGGNICVVAGEAVGQHRVAIRVPTIGKGWAGIATGYGKAS